MINEIDCVTPEIMSRQLNLMSKVGQRSHYTAEDAAEIIAIGKKKIELKSNVSMMDFKKIKTISAGAYGTVFLV